MNKPDSDEMLDELRQSYGRIQCPFDLAESIDLKQELAPAPAKKPQDSGGSKLNHWLVGGFVLAATAASMWGIWVARDLARVSDTRMPVAQDESVNRSAPLDATNDLLVSQEDPIVQQTPIRSVADSSRQRRVTQPWLTVGAAQSGLASMEKLERRRETRGLTFASSLPRRRKPRPKPAREDSPTNSKPSGMDVTPASSSLFPTETPPSPLADEQLANVSPTMVNPKVVTQSQATYPVVTTTNDSPKIRLDRLKPRSKKSTTDRQQPTGRKRFRVAASRRWSGLQRLDSKYSIVTPSMTLQRRTLREN